MQYINFGALYVSHYGKMRESLYNETAAMMEEFERRKRSETTDKTGAV